MTSKSVVTVSVQLLCIAALVLTGPVIPAKAVPLALVVAGVAVILWSVLAMGIYNVRIEPDVHRDAQLVTKGPYRVIRHPMYTGGVLIVIGWLWNDFTVFRLVAGIVLTADFVVKLLYEERLLAERFANYGEYRTRTKRLIPFLY